MKPKKNYAIDTRAIERRPVAIPASEILQAEQRTPVPLFYGTATLGLTMIAPVWRRRAEPVYSGGGKK